MNACPIGPEWNRLVRAVGEFQAYKDYVESGYQVRTPEAVREKLNMTSYEPSVRINGNLYESEPNLTDRHIEDIYQNYVNLMNRVRAGKAVEFETFRSLMSAYQVVNYKNTYIFGQYDRANAVFITRMNSSPSSKELLAEAIPAIVQKGIDVISFVPEDYAKKLERSGYTISKVGFKYDFKGEKMVKYAAASSPEVFTKIFGKPVDKINSKELEEYNDALDLRYAGVSIDSALIAQAGNDTSNILETYLNQFGIVVKDIELMQKKVGIDTMGFADILSKIAYIKDRSELPDIAGKFIAYMMQHNPLVKDIARDLAKNEGLLTTRWLEREGGERTLIDDYDSLPEEVKDKYYTIIGKLISADLKNKVTKGYSKSMLGKIKAILKEFFNLLRKVDIGKINTNIGIITNNILQQNENFIKASPYKPGAPKKPVQKVSLEAALAKDAFGKSIIYKLSNYGFILTGSTAVSEQGLILRPDENPLHDIDWVSPFNRAETEAKFREVYPDAIKVRDIIDVDYLTDTFLIAPDGHSIRNYTPEVVTNSKGQERIEVRYYEVVNDKGEVVGTYSKPESDEIVEGVEAKLIDFFVRKDNKHERGSYQFVTGDGQLIYLSNWKDTFAAKLAWARYKDIWDYNRFTPNENQPFMRSVRELAEVVPGVSTMLEGVEISQMRTDNLRAMSNVESIVRALSAKLGIPYQFVTSAQAAEMFASAGLPFTNQAGFFMGGVVYLLSDNLNTDTAFHEFSHPFIRAIRFENEKLFNKLYSDLTKTETGRKLINVVASLYPELSQDTEAFKEEVLVFAVSRHASDLVKQITEEATDPKFNGIVDKIMYAIKQVLRKYLGKSIKVSELNADTTIEDLSAMLVGATEIIFDNENVSQSDVISEERRGREEVNQLLGLGAKSSGEKVLQNTINDIYTTAINHANKLLKNKSLKEMAEVLRSVSDESDYKRIISDLNAFQTELTGRIENIRDSALYERNRAEALINTLYRLENMSEKMVRYMAELLKEEATPEIVRRFHNYNQIVREWEKVMADMRSALAKEGIINNELTTLVSKINSNLETANDFDIELGMRGSEELLTKTLEPLAEQVRTYYEGVIAELEKKGAPDRILARYRAEYEDAKLDRGAIKDWLSGKRGDTHPISAWLESFMNIQDPIIFGLASYINDNISEVLVKAQQRQNQVTAELMTMIQAAGLDPKDLAQFREAVSYVEKEGIYNQKGEYISRDRYAFIHHLKGWRDDMGRLQNAIKEAEKKAVETGDKTELTALRSALKQYLDDHYYDEYDNRVRAAESLFTKDEIGKKAYIARWDIISKINNLDSSRRQREDYLDSDFINERKSYWEDYRNLYSLTKADGTSKDPNSDEYKIAVRLLEHRAATKQFYEQVPIKGMFQGALKTFEQQLIYKGINPGSKAWDEERNRWIEENTVVRVTPQFWIDVQDILQKIRNIKAKLPQDTQEKLKMDELFKELNDQMSAYRDDNGQPDGSIMSEKKKNRIKELDQEIDNARDMLSKLSNLTPEEDKFMKDFETDLALFSFTQNQFYQTDDFDSIDEQFFKNNPDRYARYQQLADKKKDASLSEMDIDDLNYLYKQLNALRSRSATTQYYDQINSFIKTDQNGQGIDPTYLEEKTGLNYFSSYNIDVLTEDAETLQDLFEQSPEFEKWFKANHIRKEFEYTYGPNEGEKKITYKRSSAWSVTRPNDEKYYEKTDILDEAGNVKETINRVPNQTYFRRALKKEYRTERVTMKEALEMGDITKATVDEQGRWLPRPDSKYRNDEYFQMKSVNKAKFDLVNKLLLTHLQNQEGLNVNARLGVFLPRYRKDKYEMFTSGETKDRFQSMIKNFKASFQKAVDDYSEGYNAENQVTYVSLDMFDKELAGIPITGKFDLDLNETSEDVISGLFRYMLSAERQKKLIEINPNVRAIQKVVNSEEGNTKDMFKASKRDYLTQGITNFATKKGRSVRSQVINAFIEREFEGKQLAGPTENTTAINKSANLIMGLSSYAFFAFDIQSALKNSFNATFQSIIHAAGGKGLSQKSLAKGAYWAQFASAAVSFEINKFGPKSLDVQLVEIFDPEVTRFDKNDGQKFAESSTRSFKRDVANLKWVTNFRAWSQMNATLQLFGGLMHHQKVNQTVNGVTTEIPYLEAWEIKNNQLTLKEGIDKEWGIGGKKFLQMRNKVQAANKNLNGSLSRMDQPMANRYMVYRTVAYMKTWFTRQFMNRFGYRGNWRNPKHRWDIQSNEMVMGYYTEALDAIAKGIISLGKDFKYMTPDQKVAVRKMLTELAIGILGPLLINFLFDYDDDDPERYEKLRQKSGALPLLGVAEDPLHEFNATGWAENQALLLSKTTMNELVAFIPLPGFGADDYINMLKLESVAVSSTVTNLGKAFFNLAGLLTGDPSTEYKRDVGPYEWQQEGAPKILNFLAKTGGLNGKQIEGANALKNFESAQERFK